MSEATGPEGRYMLDDVMILESTYSKKKEIFGVGNIRTLNDLKFVRNDGSEEARKWEIRRQK
ncbi:hypothetical protein [Treponema brennaborense]|uniref:hypothetical protein n=1 Tax=Treponema brennaborense TaxID=81028 RepID=UPI0005A1FCEB|nr:hypothetical protein [Treponema brennaborense]